MSAQQAVIQEAQCSLLSKRPLPSKATRPPAPFLGEDLDLSRPIPDLQLCFLKAEEYSAQGPCGNKRFCPRHSPAATRGYKSPQTREAGLRGCADT